MKKAQYKQWKTKTYHRCPTHFENGEKQMNVTHQVADGTGAGLEGQSSPKSMPISIAHTLPVRQAIRGQKMSCISIPDGYPWSNKNKQR